MKAKRKTVKTWLERCSDRRWQILRAKRLEIDKFTCQECFSNGNESLQVHHRFYRKGADPWDYQTGELVTLCVTCHRQTEERLDEIKRLAGMGNGFFQERVLDVLRRICAEEHIRTAGPAPEGREPVSFDAAKSMFANLRSMLGRDQS